MGILISARKYMIQPHVYNTDFMSTIRLLATNFQPSGVLKYNNLYNY